MPTPSRPTRPVWDAVAAPHRLNLGLRAADGNEPWIDIDDDYAADVREKARLLAVQRKQVFVEREGSEPAQREVRSRVLETLLEHYPADFVRDGPRLRVVATGETFDLQDATRPALDTASRWVQEDLVVMEEQPQGWCLTAASVCFPTRWDLPSMLGRPMTAIHERVPGYREQLDTSSNKFFDGMKPGVVYRRGNWSLMDDPTLFQPTGKMQTDARPELDANNAGEKIWLRVEHQTLQRLPNTSAILFGIRIHRTRLDAVARSPEAATTLVGAIETMHPDMQRYKSLGLVREAAIAYLERALGVSS